ncbi:hypothetical protein L345_16806, partial [Ophiophagus hannah]
MRITRFSPNRCQLQQGLFVDASNDFPKIKKETPSDAEQRQFFKQILENEDAILQGNEKSLMRPPNMSGLVSREGSASAQPDLGGRYGGTRRRMNRKECP